MSGPGPRLSSAASYRPSWRLRLVWTIRLLAMTLRRHRLPAVAGCAAFAFAALSLFTCAVYLSGMNGRGRSGSALSAAAVELVAFLRDDLPESSRSTLSNVLLQLPGVAQVRLLGSEEALVRMRADLGERAGVLDGVEEGFLPATMEVTLRPGSEGAERADQIAWRLRRMDGIAEVEVLRSAADVRLTHAEAVGRRSGLWAVGLAFATMILALGLAALALRRPKDDARLLSGLGFTVAALSVPGALVGVIYAIGGAAAATAFGALGARALSAWSSGRESLVASLGASCGASFSTSCAPWEASAHLLWGGVGFLVVCGAIFGWLGACPSGRDVDEREATG